MISKQEAIDQFKAIIGAKSSWARIAKSQFVEHMAIFQSWALRAALWAVERAKQEFFLSTAVNDSSILAHVEDREYIPRKPTPASGTVTITNNGTASMSLAIGTALQGENQLPYVLTGAITLAAGASGQVGVKQVEWRTVSHTVTEEKAFYQITIPETDTPQISGLAVIVGPALWVYKRLFQNVTVNEQAYDQFYTHTGQLGIRFGNGTFGRILTAGTAVTIKLELTSGETLLLGGKALVPVDEHLDANGNPVSLTITAAESIAGGAAGETIGETRKNLHYWPVFNSKLVWHDDYEYFIDRNFPYVLWRKVWGETEEEAENGPSLNNINKIFFTAYADGIADIGERIALGFAEVNPLNRKFSFRAPLISTFNVTITGKVAKSVVISDAATEITTALAEKYDKNSAGRVDMVTVKDIYDTINKTENFTERGAYFEVEVTGTMTPTMLHELIDLGAVTINLTYL